MSTTTFRMSVLLLLLLVLPANAERLIRPAANLPDLAAPPQGSAHWIARSMRMNGLPMTLKAFESRLSADAVLSYYESQLKASGSHETRRAVNAAWRVLMFKSHQCRYRHWQYYAASGTMPTGVLKMLSHTKSQVLDAA